MLVGLFCCHSPLFRDGRAGKKVGSTGQSLWVIKTTLQLNRSFDDFRI
jgi:hypothetical protein